jgi:hypothetical protein
MRGHFFKYESIETHARKFLTLNILAIGRVWCPLHGYNQQDLRSLSRLLVASRIIFDLNEGTTNQDVLLFVSLQYIRLLKLFSFFVSYSF